MKILILQKAEQERILTENYTHALKRDVTRILELLVAYGATRIFGGSTSTLEPINYPKLFRIFERKISCGGAGTVRNTVTDIVVKQ
jgi:hypothetical protein